MALTSGTKLGPYEIQSPLGAGGMGEVYRARDTRLDRIVAIKVLASDLSSSPELKQRMEREARAISSLSNRWPVFLPDGIHYLYSAVNLSSSRKEPHSIYMGSLNSNEKRFVVKAKGNTAFTAPGNLLFYRHETLFAQHFDTKKFELTGEPVPIVTDVQFFPRIAKAVFAASNTGLLVAERNADSGVSQVLWFDRKGQQIGIALNPGIYGNVMLAPNGKVLASDTTDPASQNTNVWTYDLENRTEKRLTFDAAFDALPIWSPDGGHIVFSSNREPQVRVVFEGQQRSKLRKDRRKGPR
jgi:hypothetical protein